MVQSTLYVNPKTGKDNATGSISDPLKTIARACDRAQNQDTIRLAAGNYDTANGEKFPLVIPEGVTVIGDEASKGKNILIIGSGEYDSLTFKIQNVTLLLENNAQLKGVTVTNPVAKGTGIWIESTAPTITNCTLINCRREGMFVTGNAKPIISECLFAQNASSGLFLVRNAKGEVRSNVCQNTGYGIAVSDQAAPLLSDNQLMNNKAGIYLSRRANPVLRRNLIANNSNGGLVITGESRPEFGNAQDPAGNILRDNNNLDLRNETTFTVISVGNQLNPAKVSGKIEFPAAIVQSRTVGPSLFNDTSGHWAEPFINQLVDRNFVSGFPDGSFRPEANLTRAEYAVLIANAFNLPRQVGADFGTFKDVPENFWAARGIQKAAEMGFIAGFPDGTFRPQSKLTRVQAIVSLVNGLGLSGSNPNLLLFYQDRAQIPSYATVAIATATEKRMVVNYPQPDILEPLRDITRGEIIALIYQALVATSQADAIASPYIVSPTIELPSFVDLQQHWAASFVTRLANMDLISGFADGTFKPDTPITRAQFAALVVKVFNPTPIRPATQFLDIPVDFWAKHAIQQAYQAGFFSGFPDRTFHPEQHLRRIHLIVSLAGGLAFPTTDENLLNIYEDRAEIPTYARSAVAAATQANIIVSHPQPNKLKPLHSATRADAAAFVYQAMVYRGRVSNLDSPYIVKIGE
ncbi:MAG: S-layer homology domain-containing protein [Oscillatoria sp. PMC 1051.18]|nr:S-layer homology domain-containing protein [Oscillatoria sp. PMC 1050.18]MEC5031330.1 S-layer homology domain-containing protein [Oscillatoria sp. PMC 1051.18]